VGAGALAAGAGGVLAACSSGTKTSSASSSTSTINIGYIAPFSGSLAGFASGDNFVIDTIRTTPTQVDRVVLCAFSPADADRYRRLLGPG